jgi:hypothetical protein
MSITKDGAYCLIYPFSSELSIKEIESYKSQVFAEIEKWVYPHDNATRYHAVYYEFFRQLQKSVLKRNKEFYVAMRERCEIFKEELMQQVFHPRRVQYLLETYDYMDIDV